MRFRIYAILTSLEEWCDLCANLWNGERDNGSQNNHAKHHRGDPAQLKGHISENVE
jgi:hypothetical protein